MRRQQGQSLVGSHVTIDPTWDSRWDAFVRGHPSSVVYHTAAWARVLIDAYGYEPHYRILEETDGTIRAAWPQMLVASRITGRRLVTLPFCDHAPPLVSTSGDAQTLLEGVINDQRRLGAKRTEVRGWPAGVSSPSDLIPVQYYSRHVRDLPSSPDVILGGISKSARNHVRQAEERGVSIRLATDRHDLERFYTINVTVRRSHGLLPQPITFFEAIDRYLLQPGNGYLLLAQVGTQVVGGSLCLLHNDTVTGVFSVADPAYRSCRPTHLLWWKELEWACLHGYRHYDVGRTGADDRGLATFKEQWRFRPVQLPYYYYPGPGGFATTRPRGLPKYAVSAFSRRAPRSLVAAAGRAVYRHLG